MIRCVLGVTVERKPLNREKMLAIPVLITGCERVRTAMKETRIKMSLKKRTPDLKGVQQQSNLSLRDLSKKRKHSVSLEKTSRIFHSASFFV